MASRDFSLQPVQARDIHAIAAIGDAAMLDDKQTRFKNTAKTISGSDSGNGTQPPFADWLANPRCRLLKAVDSGTQEILGSVCWAYRGYNLGMEDGISEARSQGHEEQLATSEEAEKAAADPVDRLNDFTSKDFAVWMERTMLPGTKCMFICAISVHPNHQGRGIGTRFIRWGAEQADKDGVFCWVHASEAGYPLFLKEGFEVDKALEIDLDGYAREVENGDLRQRSWGRYTLRYMIRQPKKLEQSV
jgi:GNAT superfamily N-acetyltransferase